MKKKRKKKNRDRSSHQRCSVKKGVLRNFAKFAGKHLCQCLFFNKVAGTAFFTEHLWATAFVERERGAKP